jgi:hypothetical protein
MDLTVSKVSLTDKVIKERWAYWKTPVKKGISLIEDPLQPFGMLFEYVPKSQDSENSETLKTKTYPFLGL